MYKRLVEAALAARRYSYSPYSGFAVGAALLCGNGEIYTGCNIENKAFGPTNCAERTAVFKAVSEGVRDFEAIAIVGGKADADPAEYCYPCGVCRQVLSEFAGPELKIILGISADDYQVTTLGELLPSAF